MSTPAPWCLASTDPGRAILPEWDQGTAANRDTLKLLVDRVATLPAQCGCGRTLTDHLMVTVAILNELKLDPGVYVGLLAEALHQLAEAKQ